MTRKIYTNFLSAVLLLFTVALNAQVYNGSTVNTAGNSLVPSTGTGGCTVAPQNTGGTSFQVNVTGVSAGNVLGLVRLNMTHTWRTPQVAESNCQQLTVAAVITSPTRFSVTMLLPLSQRELLLLQVTSVRKVVYILILAVFQLRST